MYAKNPGIFPAKVTDKGYRNDPMGSLPLPYPSNMPPAIWNSEPSKLRWVTTGLPSGIFARATWASPIFDLRPEFRNSGMPRGTGQAYLVAQAPSLNTNRGPSAVATVLSNTGAVPIWRPSGAGGKLWVQTMNLQSGAMAAQTGFGFRVTAREFANINDPTDLQQIAPVEDITSDFTGLAPSALSIFVPPGSGYPARYYRCKLTFDYTNDITVALNWDGGAGNPIRLLAAYY